MTATAAKNGKTNIADKAKLSHALEIPQIELREAVLGIVGISPLITHAWSEKAVKLMEQKQQKIAGEQKQARNPVEEFRAAAYVFPGSEWTGNDDEDWKPGKFCLPASAFKHVFLYGVSQLGDTKNMPKTQATGWVFPVEDPTLNFSSVTHRVDVGRIGQGTATPVYRPQFNDWSVDLKVSFNARAITVEQVVSLFDLGGFSGGIGEWRPSAPKNKSGNYGRFRVERVEAA